MQKVLYLTLFKEWFDEIKSGKKKTEYREAKPFWKKRLFNSDGSVREYEEIVFINGYGLKRPRMRVEFLGVREENGRYEILLGSVIQTFNCP